jgi:hypothetical protein
MAYVVRKPGSALTAEEVMKFVAEQVSVYYTLLFPCMIKQEVNSRLSSDPHFHLTTLTT